MDIINIRNIISQEVVTIAPEVPASEAIALMAKARISCVIVANEGKPLGIFTERDIVKEASLNASFATRPICDFMSSPVVTISADLSILRPTTS